MYIFQNFASCNIAAASRHVKSILPYSWYKCLLGIQKCVLINCVANFILIQRNPDIKLCGLSWAFPGWLGNGSGNPYKYPNETANYTLKWILAAKKFYQLDIDYIGVRLNT